MRLIEKQAARDQSRQGIALVIVLGFLAILLIMGVGFAVSMRVERIISRSALDHIRARQFGEAALARVVWDINDSVGDALFPKWSGDWTDGAFVSLNNSSPTFTNIPNFFYGHVTNYVPLALWTATTNAVKDAEWIPFTYTDNGQEHLIGRYSYIVLDCSGFLDVNFDYDPTNNHPIASRRFGENPRELSFTNTLLREIRNPNTNPRVWTNMIVCRLSNTTGLVKNPWGRLETIAEFNPLITRGYANQQPAGPNTNSVNFMAYSRFPRGYVDSINVVQQPIRIPPNMATLPANASSADVLAFKSRLQTIGITDSDNFFLNLRDYSDSDHQPLKLDSFGTEAVPMVNEVVVSNRFTISASGVYSNEYRVLVEVWYPFTTANSDNYDVRIIARYNDMSPPELGGATLTINETIPMNVNPWTLGRFYVVTSSVRVASTTNAAMVNFASANVDVSARVVARTGGAEVDRVGGTAATILNIPIGQSYEGGASFVRGKAADDPRINWDGSNPIQWREPANPRSSSSYTLGRTNANLTYNNAGADGHTLMYVADRPLNAVGELGQLLYDATKPWHTVSLIDGPSFMPVLDHFTLTTNEVRYGLVNPNSYISNVVATVYHDMPVERVPYDPVGFRMNATQARTLAGQQRQNIGAITNVSDLRFLGPSLQTTFAAITNLPLSERPGLYESVVANSAGLLSPRQQLYTVILATQVLGPNTNVLAEQRGVGVIWRDPYITSNGVHQTFVRNFRWLTE
ncbi:MAG: hypothetical protein H3C50_10530 [Kiritimatiellae bacterium]|nr:hypothetical protein [Kiritimatiellia bacterium]MCO6400768.1 hypothetical protein [Verrucomicrobiota bacterium]